MSITPYCFAQLLEWCAPPRETTTPALCCPRFIEGLWIASDGKALAWRRSDSPHDQDPLLSAGLLGLQHRVHDMESHWPTVWHNLPVSSLPPFARHACQSCKGAGLSRSVDDGEHLLGLWHCDNCDGAGHVDGLLVRPDIAPTTHAIGIDYLLRIGPCDRIAWVFNPLLRGGGCGLLVGETPSGLRYAIMPISLPGSEHPTHQLRTTPHRES